jgi:hypothetical protein
MPYLFIFLHTLALIFLIRSIWWAVKAYSIPLTSHSLPIIGIWGLLLLATIWLSIMHPWIYLWVGAVLGLFQFTLDSIEIPGRPNYSLLGKLVSATSVVALWPELGSFTIFCVWHADKIIDEEFKP